MQDEAIYRCINPACARAMPRRVNYCPYCGTAQATGMPASASAPVAGDAQADRAAAAAVAAAAGAQAAAGLAGWSDAPDAPDAAAVPPAPDRVAAPAAAASQAASGPAGPASASATAAPAASAQAWHTAGGASRSDAPSGPTAGAAQPAAPSAHAFGRSGRPVDAGAAPAGTSGRGRGIPWPPAPSARPRPATPQGRQPIRLRWWILTLVVLWGVWLWAKPSTKKIDRRIDAAIAMAQACQGKQAQDELIALRDTRATPRQLERLQRALNEASSACTRKRQRVKAWDEARESIETALAARNAERARTRLAAFTKRWGEDDDTRAFEGRIDALRREHPLAVPEGNSGAAREAAPPPGNLF